LRNEFRCDLVATQFNLRTQESFNAEDMFRAQLFVWYVLAELAALTKSAIITAESAVADEDLIDLSSAEPLHHAFACQIVRDEAFDIRVTALEMVLTRMAAKEGIVLFDAESAFPMARATRTALHSAQQSIVDISEEPIVGLMGTDAQRRGLAQILAESLKGHRAGADFLLWRSKKFNRANDLHFE
jgi:hypothetical protein